MTPNPLQGASLLIATIFISLGTFIQILDTSIANVALPYIAGDLAVSNNQGTWVITSFAVGNAISLPLTGELAKRYGAVRTFVTSITLFTIFSWLCGGAPTFPILIGARFMQGVVAGPLIPLSQSLLILNYPKEKTNVAISLFVMVAVVGPILGPILGGWITENYRWNWIFYINIPTGTLSALFVWRILKDRETPVTKPPFDWAGLILLIATVGPLQVLLDKGEQLDWFGSPVIWGLAVLTVIALSFLLVREFTARAPLLDLRLFARRNYAIGTLVTSLSYMCFFGAVVITPLWLQTQMGYTAFWAGLAVAPMGAVPLLLGLVVPRIMAVVPLRLIILTCFALFAFSYYIFSLNTTAINFQTLALQRLLFGVPLWIYFTPLVSMSLGGIEPSKLSSAAGLFHFFRIFSGGAGTALFAYAWQRRAAYHHARLAEMIDPFNVNVESLTGALRDAGLKGAANLDALNALVDKQAYMLATNDVFRAAAFLCLGAILFIVLFKKQKAPQGAPAVAD